MKITLRTLFEGEILLCENIARLKDTVEYQVTVPNENYITTTLHEKIFKIFNAELFHI